VTSATSTQAAAELWQIWFTPVAGKRRAESICRPHCPTPRITCRSGVSLSASLPCDRTSRATSRRPTASCAAPAKIRITIPGSADRRVAQFDFLHAATLKRTTAPTGVDVRRVMPWNRRSVSDMATSALWPSTLPSWKWLG
jgi:hypothetical protein